MDENGLSKHPKGICLDLEKIKCIIIHRFKFVRNAIEHRVKLGLHEFSKGWTVLILLDETVK